MADPLYEATLIERLRPAFVRADAEWLLDEENVVEVIAAAAAAGDTTWLARDLNLEADICILTWIPEQTRMTAAQGANFRRYARALKAAAAVLHQLFP